MPPRGAIKLRLRFVLIACVVAILPLQAHANPTTETQENDFLDLVDSEGNVLVQGRGVDAVNAEAKAQGLAFPALGLLVAGGSLLCETCSGGLQRCVQALRAFRRLRCRGRLHTVIHTQRREENEVARHQTCGDNNSRENL